MKAVMAFVSGENRRKRGFFSEHKAPKNQGKNSFLVFLVFYLCLFRKGSSVTFIVFSVHSRSIRSSFQSLFLRQFPRTHRPRPLPSFVITFSSRLAGFSSFLRLSIQFSTFQSSVCPAFLPPGSAQLANK